jgi:hypothetical protein
MYSVKSAITIATALVCALAFNPVQAQQVLAPQTAADVAPPVPGQIMTEEYARVIGQFAYMWAWPMMNMHNRRNAFDKLTDPVILGVAPAAPVNSMAMLTDYIDPAERIVATPNQDVVYGITILSLDREPVVLQVPDFGNRFWVYQLADQRTNSFGSLGAMYDSKPGFYLLVGPNWKGEPPEGIEAIIRSPTVVGGVFPRVFVDDVPADHAAIQPLINQINAYPLSKFTGEMQIRDWTKLPVVPSSGEGSGETKWVVPETFFAQLRAVLDEVPPMPGEEAIYAQIRALLQSAEADPKIMAALIKAAQDTETGLFGTLFNWRNQGLPLDHGWTKMVNCSVWGSDYMTRASAAKANIFCNSPNETTYFALDLNADGARLSGDKTYTITFKKGQTPPVKGFWSLTMYNEHHFFEPNSINRYSVGTKNKGLKFAEDGSLTIHISNEMPADPNQLANWLPAPKGDFSLYVRSYWPESAITDGTWTPPAVVQVR